MAAAGAEAGKLAVMPRCRLVPPGIHQASAHIHTTTMTLDTGLRVYVSLNTKQVNLETLFLVDLLAWYDRN